MTDLRIVRGSGGHCWGADGRRYVDFICGYGPVVLGHANPEVNEAVTTQLNDGLLLPGECDLADELEETIQRLYGRSVACHFVKTGSEAVAAAVRLARISTGRTRVIRCGFHGWHDLFVAPYLEWHQYKPAFAERPDVGGVQYDSDLIGVWDGVSLEDLSRLLKTPNRECAAVIVDPVQISEPIGESLKAIAALTRSAGAMFVLDEAKTCFRVSLAGVQGLYDACADITVLSKALGNGFPIAAVMADPAILKNKRRGRLKGTYNSERASLAAALRTLNILSRPGAIDALSATGQTLIDGMNAVFAGTRLKGAVRAVPYRWPCMPFVSFSVEHQTGGSDIQTQFFRALAGHGVLLLQDHMSFTCVSHTATDVQEAVGAVSAVVSASDAWS